MSAILSLMWKEMEECVPSFLLGVVALTGFTTIGLQSRLLPDAAIIALNAGGVMILTLLVSAGLTATERAEGSIMALRALPVRPMVTMLLKLAAGAGTLTLVVAMVAVTAVALAGHREIAASEILAAFAAMATMAVNLLMWFAAFNVRMRGEGAASLVSLGVLVTLMTILNLLGEFTPRGSVWWFAWTPWAVIQGANGFLGSADFGTVLYHGWPSLLTSAGMALLAAWRFSQLERSRG